LAQRIGANLRILPNLDPRFLALVAILRDTKIMTPYSAMSADEVTEVGKEVLEAQLSGWRALRKSFETKALATSDAQDALSFANAMEVAARGERQALIDLSLLNKNRAMA